MKLQFSSIFFFLVVIQIFPQSAWVKQESGTNETLFKVRFIDKNRGMVLGTNNTILRTSNGGQNWEKLSGITNELIIGLNIFDSDKFIIVGGNGTILYTSDIGTTWNKMNTGIKGRNFTSISFLNNNKAVVVGADPIQRNVIILKTTNGGNDWVTVSDSQYQFTPLNVFYNNDSLIVIIGVTRTSWGELVLLKSLDQGKTLEKEVIAYFPSSGSYSGASFANSKVGLLSFWTYMMAETRPYVLKTTNGGINWESVWHPGKYISGIQCITPEIFTSTGDDAIYRSIDSGENWKIQESEIDVTLRDIFFVDPEFGTIVGDKGTIFHTTFGGSIPKIEIKYPEENTIFHFGKTKFLKLNGDYIGSMKLELSIDNGKSWDFVDSLNSTDWGKEYDTNSKWSHLYEWKVWNSYSDSCYFRLTCYEADYITGKSPIFRIQNTVSIQDLINDAAPGDTLFLSDPEYIECFKITKPITIIGNGNSPTKISGDTMKPVITIQADNVTIKYLIVAAKDQYHLHTDTTNHVPVNGIEITKSTNVTLDNLQITAGKDLSTYWLIPGGIGLKVDSSRNIQILNSKLFGAAGDLNEDGGDGLKIKNCDSIKVINCEINGGQGGNGSRMGAVPTKGGYGGHSLNLIRSFNIEIINSHLIGGIGGKTAGSTHSYTEQAKAGDGAYCDSSIALFKNSIFEGGKALINIPPWNVPLNTLGGNGLTVINHSNVNFDGGTLIQGQSSSDASGKRFFIDFSSSINFINVDPKIYPIEYFIKQNYPNPFNSTTTIEYSIPEQTHVTLKIFDLLGREILVLTNERKVPGNYRVEFNGTSMPSGVYFYRLETEKFTETKKLILMK